MTRQEAKVALTEGKKLTHWLFTEKEFIFMDGGILKDENMYHINWTTFWNDRQGKNFDTGWTEFKLKD